MWIEYFLQEINDTKYVNNIMNFTNDLHFAEQAINRIANLLSCKNSFEPF